jgi:hypothetical protein
VKPRYWLDFAADWKSAPMAYWVHVEADGRPWRDARAFAPPAPVPNGHWLSRLPASLKSSKARRRAVKALQDAPRALRAARG